MLQCQFGTVVYRGRVYSCDVYVHPSGRVEPRRVELQPGYSSGHRVGAAEIEWLLQEDPDYILIGTGFNGALHLTQDAREFLEEKGALYRELLTPRAVEEYNRSYNCAILVHVTC